MIRSQLCRRFMCRWEVPRDGLLQCTLVLVQSPTGTRQMHRALVKPLIGTRLLHQALVKPHIGTRLLHYTLVKPPINDKLQHQGLVKPSKGTRLHQRLFHDTRILDCPGDISKDVKGMADDENRSRSDLITEDYFNRRQEEEQNKESFEGALDIFTHKDSRRRGSVEFIYAAMRNMEQFGVHKDLGSYKKLMEVFPKGKMIPDNRLQADFFHYPKQQQCATTLLLKMEKNKVMPDEEMGDILLNTFGKYATPYKRYCRMMYWMPKFKNLSPWPLPDELPGEALELAKLAIRQITSVDPITKLEVLDTANIPDSNDQTWVVSGQSRDQQELLEGLKKGTALYVEGAFRVWLKESQVSYFIIRGPPIPAPPPPQIDDDALGSMRRWMDGEKAPGGTVARLPTVHEQEDGTILAVCATGSSSRDSLLSWVRHLELANPRLADMVVLFTLTSPLGPVIPVKESSSVSRH